tara:strand:- start:1179 stop:1451 length:273 start_codon:yes stop_codon:yes gene_type:complete
MKKYAEGCTSRKPDGMEKKKRQKKAMGGMTGMAGMDNKDKKDMGMGMGMPTVMAKGGKLKMVEKDGKKVPFYAADGKGKMMYGGMAKKKA